MKEGKVKTLTGSEGVVWGKEVRGTTKFADFGELEEGSRLTVQHSNGFGYAVWILYEKQGPEFVEIDHGTIGDPDYKDRFLSGEGFWRKMKVKTDDN